VIMPITSSECLNLSFASDSSLSRAPICLQNGRKPPQLTAQTLMRLTPRLPTGWPNSESSSAFAENKSSILRVPASNHFGFAADKSAASSSAECVRKSPIINLSLPRMERTYGLSWRSSTTRNVLSLP
jgi:hypothetical protein